MTTVYLFSTYDGGFNDDDAGAHAVWRASKLDFFPFIIPRTQFLLLCKRKHGTMIACTYSHDDPYRSNKNKKRRWCALCARVPRVAVRSIHRPITSIHHKEIKPTKNRLRNWKLLLCCNSCARGEGKEIMA